MGNAHNKHFVLQEVSPCNYARIIRLIFIIPCVVMKCYAYCIEDAFTVALCFRLRLCRK